MSAGIVIAGPPGVGKTTVGQLVAARLGRRLVDLDALVEARAARPPHQIIEQDGEARFRALEAEALEAIGPSDDVVALGGGALTSRRTRVVARRLGPLVRLDAPREVLEARLARSAVPRPLARSGLDALLERRQPTYAAVDAAVDGSGPPEAVAERVAALAPELRVLNAPFLGSDSRILVGLEIEEAIAGAVAHLEPKRPVLLVRDEGVPKAVRGRIEARIASRHPVVVVDVVGGEPAKTWAVLGEVLARALAQGCGRQSAVVGLGGGAVCDLTSLVAHLLGRGAPTVLVPTTLLAQVDASVGGKCAINHGDQRNPVGAFHPPDEIVIDLALLASLPPPELRSGWAELVKIAIIDDPSLFERLEAGEAPNPDLVARAVAAKARIVGRDPLEQGERRKLNLGHTLGHALEAASGFELRHGEAVAIGMVAALRASVEAGYAQAALADRVEGLLRALGLPVAAATPALLEAARAHVGADKKGDAESVEWVFVRALGNVDTERVPWSELQSRLFGGGGRR